MSKHNCIGNSELYKGDPNQLGLGIGRPHHAARTFAVAETGTVENDNPVILGSEVDQTTGVEVLDHASVAVKKNHRSARTSFHIVKPDAIYFQKSTSRRIVVLRLLRKIPIDQCGRG